MQTPRMSSNSRAIGLTIVAIATMLLVLFAAGCSSSGEDDSAVSVDTNATATPGPTELPVINVTVVAATSTPSADATATVAPTTTVEPTATVAATATPTANTLSVANGTKLFDTANFTFWGVPNASEAGCEGNASWRVVTAKKDSDVGIDGTDERFSTLPAAWFSADGGYVFASSCEEQSHTVVHTTVASDGTFGAENTVVPAGYEDRVIRNVSWVESGSPAVLFEVAEGDGTRAVLVNPVNGAVNKSFILGDPAEGCSAAGRTLTLPDDPNLSAEAKAKRDAIAAAAVSCDFAALAALTPDQFHYNFAGDQRGAARWWAMNEQIRGQDDLSKLVDLLSTVSYPTTLDDATDSYVWPIAHALGVENLSAEGRQQLIDLGYDPDAEIAAGTFYGFRTAITDDGTWLYFIAGD